MCVQYLQWNTSSFFNITSSYFVDIRVQYMFLSYRYNTYVWPFGAVTFLYCNLYGCGISVFSYYYNCFYFNVSPSLVHLPFLFMSGLYECISDLWMQFQLNRLLICSQSLWIICFSSLKFCLIFPYVLSDKLCTRTLKWSLQIPTINLLI